MTLTCTPPPPPPPGVCWQHHSLTSFFSLRAGRGCGTRTQPPVLVWIYFWGGPPRSEPLSTRTTSFRNEQSSPQSDRGFRPLSQNHLGSPPSQPHSADRQMETGQRSPQQRPGAEPGSRDLGSVPSLRHGSHMPLGAGGGWGVAGGGRGVNAGFTRRAGRGPGPARAKRSISD